MVLASLSSGACVTTHRVARPTTAEDFARLTEGKPAAVITEQRNVGLGVVVFGTSLGVSGAVIGGILGAIAGHVDRYEF